MATMIRGGAQPVENSARRLFPLENGDRLTAAEFHRRYEAMPELRKAELIGGRVYIADPVRHRLLDPSIPPLENGDHLDWEEFERRYDNMPDLKKAELIDGVVYMQSPVRARHHGIPHLRLSTWMGVYESETFGVEGGDNSTLRLEGSNGLQPDLFLRILSECGGRSKINERGYIIGSPELLAEIAASRVSYDLHDKLDLYRRAGVREYIVWKVLEEEILWLMLRGEDYVPLQPDTDGFLKSEMFPGLWLDAASLIAGNLQQVLKVLQIGTATAEHAAFVDQLWQFSP